MHHGIELQFDGERHRIPLTELAGGRTIVVYGQTEVVKDLIAARLASGAPLLFEVAASRVHELDSEAPRIRYGHDGRRSRSSSATSSPAATASTACAARPSRRRRCARTRATTRSAGSASWPRARPRATSSSTRTTSAASPCTACAPGDQPPLHPVPARRGHRRVARRRIWEELQVRLGPTAGRGRGPGAREGRHRMRSFVTEPMHYGRLYLAGDAAHIVPPTGAKGLNLAVADVRVLAEALASWHATGSKALLDGYSETCLRRVWRAEHFSVVDDVDAAPLARRRPLRRSCSSPSWATSARRARPRRAGRELRRAGGFLAVFDAIFAPRVLLDELE